MKQYINIFLAATALTTVSCSDSNFEEILSNEEKEMISFSLSDAANSRAGFTGADTKIVMRIESNERLTSNKKYTRTVALAKKDESNNDATGYSAVQFENSDIRYWDDAHGRKSHLSIYAVAIPNKKADAILPTTTLEAGDASNTWGTTDINTLTWLVDQAQTLENIANKDLTYSNNIKSGGTNGVYRWNFSTGNWKNSDNGGSNHDNGQMLFYQNGVEPTTTAPTDAAGHFDRGHMVFNHALSRITITLEEGTGFNSGSSDDFKFAESTGIKAIGMPYRGTFDVSTNTWTSQTSGEINPIAPLGNYTTAAGQYRLQVLPGYTFAKTGTDNVFEFTIDNNVYYITQKMLFDALTYDANGDGNKDTGDGDLLDKKDATGITMEMGKNYNFKIKVNKKGIDNITASLVNWSDVNAAESPFNNGHINITTSLISSSVGGKCSDLYLYRNGQDLSSINTGDTYSANQYQADYLTTGNSGIQPTETSSESGIWNTSWYFEDNKTAYHIRSINSTAHGSSGTNVKNPSSGNKYTYFELANGAQSDHDYHWGAPMSSTNFTYNTSEGYKNHLQKGITALNDGQAINITELHMMSNINVVLTTSSGSDAVKLQDGENYATVKITRLQNKGQVDMGIGLVTPTGDVVSEETMTNPKVNTAYSNKYFKQNSDNSDITTETNPFTWAVVPQALKRGDSSNTDESYYVGITITTPDNNQYYVIKDLYSIKPTSVGTSNNQTTDKAITRWYPNHKYTYTFKITKKGITNITCSLVNWSDVTAGNKDITLED